MCIYIYIYIYIRVFTCGHAHDNQQQKLITEFGDPKISKNVGNFAKIKYV